MNALKSLVELSLILGLLWLCTKFLPWGLPVTACWGNLWTTGTCYIIECKLDWIPFALFGWIFQNDVYQHTFTCFNTMTGTLFARCLDGVRVHCLSVNSVFYVFEFCNECKIGAAYALVDQPIDLECGYGALNIWVLFLVATTLVLAYRKVLVHDLFLLTYSYITSLIGDNIADVLDDVADQVDVLPLNPDGNDASESSEEEFFDAVGEESDTDEGSLSLD